MKPTSAQRVPEVIEGPAKETGLHVWNRPATDDHMRPIVGRMACTKWTPLEAAYHQGKLGEKDSADARSRLNAGLTYAGHWDGAQASGRDSTQALNISRSIGAGSDNSSRTIAAANLATIEAALSQRDRIIIRMVCGEGHFPSEAVALVSPDYAKATVPRFREALDALAEVIATVKVRVAA